MIGARFWFFNRFVRRNCLVGKIMHFSFAMDNGCRDYIEDTL